MKSHELANLLLANPDMDVATGAMGHLYSSSQDAFTHGPLVIGKLHHYGGKHIFIGGGIAPDSFDNGANWHIEDVIYVEVRA